MRRHEFRAVGAAALCGLLALAAGACVDPREEPLDNSEIWDEDVSPGEPGALNIEYRDRAEGARYGLPRPGEPGIADIIALFPDEPAGFNDPDIFTGPGMFTGVAAEQCRGGGPGIVDLPQEIEAVVTVYPRQYMKVGVCGQDERHYGSFTVEDDTGGIIVLRDSRVAPYSYGDRVKINVKSLMLTFGRDLDTRAILSADLSMGSQLIENGQVVRPIIFEKQREGFSARDSGKVKQIEGFVHVQPTNMNFNSMVLTDREVPLGARDQDLQGPALQCARTCEVTCLQNVCENGEVCADACADTCVRTGGDPVRPDDLPVCWNVGIDAELGRRGFSPTPGTHLKVRGPVVNNFDRQIWVLDLGQLEILD